MLDVNENSTCTFYIRWNELVTFQGSKAFTLLKQCLIQVVNRQ